MTNVANKLIRQNGHLIGTLEAICLALQYNDSKEEISNLMNHIQHEIQTNNELINKYIEETVIDKYQ